MQEIRQRRKVSVLGLRASAPKVVRVLALGLIVAGVGAVVVSYMRLRNRTEFRLRPGVAELSTTVVGRMENFEHRAMRNGRLHVLLRASLDLTF